MDLVGHSALDGIVFLAHDIPPDQVEFVKNLGDTCLSHLTVEGLFDLENDAHSFCRNPVVVNSLFLLAHFSGGSSCSSVSVESVGDAFRALPVERLGSFHDFCVFHLSVVSCVLQQRDQTFVVSLQLVKFNLERTFSLPGLVQILESDLLVGDLLPQVVVLLAFQVHLEFELRELVFKECNLRTLVYHLAVFLLEQLLNTTNVLFSDINFVLLHFNL